MEFKHTITMLIILQKYLLVNPQNISTRSRLNVQCMGIFPRNSQCWPPSGAFDTFTMFGLKIRVVKETLAVKLRRDSGVTPCHNPSY